MAVQQASLWCDHCGDRTLHERHYFGGAWGWLFTILTGGLFAPIWLLIAIVQQQTRPQRCQRCGRDHA